MPLLARRRVALAVLLSVVLAARADAADNELTPDEKAAGWELLFDGKSGDGWSVAGRPVPAANVGADGTINPRGVGEGRNVYVMTTTKAYGDFVLAADFKVTPDCNSGIFFRVADPADPVQTGLEMQIFDAYPWGRDPAWTRIREPNDAKYYGCGALYAAQEPARNAARPAGEWNHVEITAAGPRLRFVLNGAVVNDVNLDDWVAGGRNPDGTENKYAKRLKDFPRVGVIGLQDHKHDVWFKNLKIKSLEPQAKRAEPAKANANATDEVGRASAASTPRPR